MTLRFASLGSGSEGNALLVESVDGATSTRILLDCGFGIRETVRRLERLGCAPESLNAILVTHEHGDHVGSAYVVAAKYNIPVWTSHGTYRATVNLRGADRAAVAFAVPMTCSALVTCRSCHTPCRTMRVSRCSSSSTMVRVTLVS